MPLQKTIGNKETVKILAKFIDVNGRACLCNCSVAVSDHRALAQWMYCKQLLGCKLLFGAIILLDLIGHPKLFKKPYNSVGPAMQHISLGPCQNFINATAFSCRNYMHMKPQHRHLYDISQICAMTVLAVTCLHSLWDETEDHLDFSRWWIIKTIAVLQIKGWKAQYPFEQPSPARISTGQPEGLACTKEFQLWPCVTIVRAWKRNLKLFFGSLQASLWYTLAFEAAGLTGMIAIRLNNRRWSAGDWTRTTPQLAGTDACGKVALQPRNFASQEASVVMPFVSPRKPGDVILIWSGTLLAQLNCKTLLASNPELVFSIVKEGAFVSLFDDQLIGNTSTI